MLDEQDEQDMLDEHDEQINSHYSNLNCTYYAAKPPPRWAVCIQEKKLQ
jgi:hypothetical protein